MTRLIPLALLSLLGLPACTQSQKGDITIGKTETIYSHILNEQRRIIVHLPQSDTAIFKTQRYPVVYLLDGDAHFPSVMGLIQQLTEVNGNMVIPGMILVAIPNTNRQRDLTPTHAKSSPYGDSNSVRGTGGGENFTAFLEKELIPHIDSLYPTAPYRIFIGHSLGGLMVINTLINHPRLFNAYIAIDPSMWWDDQRLLKQADSVLAQQNFTGKTLYLSIANTMPPGMDTARVRTDTARATTHIRSILQLKDDIKKNAADGLRFDYRYYGGDSHGSVPIISEYDGLRFIFDYYNPSFGQMLFDSKTRTADAIAAVKTHFETVSRQMGYSFLPPEEWVNGMAYNFLQQKQLDKSLAFFQLNTENYPNSGNAFDSLGDYYRAAGDHAKAVEAYTKALTRWDNPETKKKLAEERSKIH